MKRIDQYWYDNNLVSLLLTPLSWLFCLLVGVRRLGYRFGVFRSLTLPVPVVVVGNITVGGSGKTPLIAWLTKRLEQAGYRPGVISRGYGGRTREHPVKVTSDSDPAEVGDEPLLLARRTGCPIVVGRDRVSAAQGLIDWFGVDVILSDDGLQHYRLGRRVEVAVVDAVRRFGNGHCIPAGPLRERPSRLRTVDLIVYNGGTEAENLNMRVEGKEIVNLLDNSRTDLTSLAGREVHAVAGIGNPKRFFELLRANGLRVIEHPFPDHHPLAPSDLAFGDKLPVIMTEKDAVKCEHFAVSSYWYLPITAQMPEAFMTRLFQLLGDENHGQETS